MKINERFLSLNTSLPYMMKYSDVCAALDINDDYFYKLIKKNRLSYVRFNGSIRVPASLFAAYLVEGPSFNRSDDFIRMCYIESLLTFPSKLNINDICRFMNVSRSTVKRVIQSKAIKYEVLHTTCLIQIKKNDFISFLVANTIK